MTIANKNDSSRVEFNNDVGFCPFCGNQNLTELFMPSYHAAICTDCGASGPQRPTSEEAWESWRRRYSKVTVIDLDQPAPTSADGIQP